MNHIPPNAQVQCILPRGLPSDRRSCDLSVAELLGTVWGLLSVKQITGYRSVFSLNTYDPFLPTEAIYNSCSKPQLSSRRFLPIEHF